MDFRPMKHGSTMHSTWLVNIGKTCQYFTDLLDKLTIPSSYQECRCAMEDQACPGILCTNRSKPLQRRHTKGSNKDLFFSGVLIRFIR